MTLVRLNPSKSIFNLKNDMDRLFDNFFTGRLGLTDSMSDIALPVDVEENEHEYLVTADLPGMKKDDIKITFENNYLTISGEKKSKKEISEDNYHLIERRQGKFSRSLAIPSGVKADHIEADYEQGVLTVKIPKAEEAKPKQIEVKVK